MLLLEKLRSNNFDFEQLPSDVHKAAKIVLTNDVCPQIEVLDQTTFEIIAKLNPANPSVQEVVKIMKSEPENDGFNTRISENKFEKGGPIKLDQKIGDFVITKYDPVKYNNDGSLSGGMIKLVNQINLDTIIINNDLALRDNVWFVNYNNVQIEDKSPEIVVSKFLDKYNSSKKSESNTDFIYGTKYFVPPDYGNQIVEKLKSFYGFDVEFYKPDAIIVSKNNKKALVNDNTGEFNLIEFNAENIKFEEDISNIGYDGTTGIVPPEVLAANIYFDFVDYFELPNDFMEQAIEVNTKIEDEKPDDWTKTLMKNRAVKKAIFTITQNVDLTEIIYVIIYRYTINREELPKPALKNPFTSTIKKEEFTKLVNNFENFVPALQRKYLLDVFKSEEKELAIDIARRLYDIFNRMPKTYETENTPKERKVLWLHYFYSGSDWYIIEKDMYPDQYQAFGYAILNGDTENAEMGYISITELMSIRGVELDFYFTPITFGELFKEETELQLTNQQEKLLYEAQLTDSYVELQKSNFEANFKLLEAAGIIYTTPSLNRQNVDVYLTDKGKDFVANYTFKKENKVALPQPVVIEEKKYTYFKGTQHSYENPFTLNKAIEELVDELTPQTITPEQKTFISYYSGYGGLEKFGATGKGLLYEYFTPTDIVKKMWGLAYKHGYKGGPLLEPSVGVGEFIKFAPAQEMVTAYEINPYSAKICRLLFPNITLVEQPFETMFIKNRESIKNKLIALKKFDLVIGNPPYGDFQGIYAGMGEKAFTHAENYIDYFISRGLDALNKNGLLIFIIGTEVAAGGKPFLQKPMTKAKAEIAKKSVLLDAYRLPNGVFERTDVLSDIIVLQKL